MLYFFESMQSLPSNDNQPEQFRDDCIRQVISMKVQLAFSDRINEYQNNLSVFCADIRKN